VLGVEHQEIEAGERGQIDDSRRRPAEKTAEQRRARADARTEGVLSFQFSVFSFRIKAVVILLKSCMAEKLTTEN
jgi:hypothetical protein